MKVGKLIQPNKKGQIVIPREMRIALNINEDTTLNIIQQGNGVYMEPVKQVMPNEGKEDMYIKLLQYTQGAWGKESEELENDNHLREIEAARERKKPW